MTANFAFYSIEKCVAAKIFADLKGVFICRFEH